MKARLLALLLLPFPAQALIPLPQEMSRGEGRLSLAPGFQIEPSGPADPRIEGALRRFRARAEGRMGALAANQGAPDAKLKVEWKSQGLAVQGLREDESYALEITPQEARLSADNALGVMHGLETLLQHLNQDPRAGWGWDAVAIKDAPRFAWRGLLLDVCRHWMPLEVVRRQVDGLAAAKMNVLHWHLSEDQGFRVESKQFPKLHELGSDGNYYTQAQVRELVAYARGRGVRVVPEFDMPGHVTAWVVGYPELASAPGPYKIERKFGIFDPAFDPSREATFEFLEIFLAEMTALFPDAYFHTGGDENNGKQWNANPGIQKFMLARGLRTNEDLQAYFSGRVSKILEKLGKKMMGWDEIMHTELPAGTVVHAWRGTDSLVEASRRGYDTVLSNGYYLDLQRPAGVHYANDPAAPGLSLTAQQLGHVLGGEACMWAELVDPGTVDGRIWPRNLAVAERLWSPASVADLEDHHRRAAEWASRAGELGLRLEYDGKLVDLVGKAHAADLRLLAEQLSQVQHYQRHRSRAYLQSTPLNRLVDAVPAESVPAFHFRRRVDRFLEGDASLEKGLEAEFKLWAARMPGVKKALAGAARAEEAAQLAQDQADLAEAGLLALKNLRSGKTLYPESYDQLSRKLDRLAAPKAELELACLPAVRKLVLAMNSQDKKKELGGAEWGRWLDGKVEEASKKRRH